MMEIIAERVLRDMEQDLQEAQTRLDTMGIAVAMLMRKNKITKFTVREMDYQSWIEESGPKRLRCKNAEDGESFTMILGDAD